MNDFIIEKEHQKIYQKNYFIIWNYFKKWVKDKVYSKPLYQIQGEDIENYLVLEAQKQVMYYFEQINKFYLFYKGTSLLEIRSLLFHILGTLSQHLKDTFGLYSFTSSYDDNTYTLGSVYHDIYYEFLKVKILNDSDIIFIFSDSFCHFIVAIYDELNLIPFILAPYQIGFVFLKPQYKGMKEKHLSWEQTFSSYRTYQSEQENAKEKYQDLQEKGCQFIFELNIRNLGRNYIKIKTLSTGNVIELPEIDVINYIKQEIEKQKKQYWKITLSTQIKELKEKELCCCASCKNNESLANSHMLYRMQQINMNQLCSFCRKEIGKSYYIFSKIK